VKKIANPPNPFLSAQRELLEPADDAKLEIYEDTSRNVLTKNESPDLSFTWSVNPYRGCFHSCAYCYARRYHEYLDMGAGTDFESKLVIKPEAPALLKAAFMKRTWTGEMVMFSGVTDCYQPIEAVYKLTQGCVQVCRDFRNPTGLITKSFLITRDVELLAELNRVAFCTVAISIPFASDEMARKIEPQASTIERRFQALETLAKAGIPVGVSLAPTIPGLNENDMPSVLKRAKDCGARYAFHSLVRLSGSVLPVFEEKIKAALPPERVDRILKRLRETRQGKMNDSRFGHRNHGEGTYWKSISDVFRLNQAKYGLTDYPVEPFPSTFRRPSAQMELSLDF
jgi:DNA repair photolyase